MFVNLHNLEPGQALYTLHVGDDPDSWIEEVDVVASRSARLGEIVAAADLDDFDAKYVFGIVDQSAGETLFDGQMEMK